ncbi:biopolymer transporter ExbD [Thalassotalea litorea]|uniref:Biopolymer transporter ExbD n=1 Tax=Thalassotalea litorea TaxID=2020715 RepID=A0A5R9IHX1_9GAMM|nr:biopolymer transporter ExbD [Thalassotalea litorea]TLU65115.1 biopolymer transporter ExbD [Thalassotalea litorea]
MKQSLRAKRMQRHHQRNSKTSKLSLVSLMDIFTILVFFLMVNASDVQVLQTNKQLELPESVSEEAAEDNLLIMVNASNVILQGRQIISVEELTALDSVIVDSLNAELEYQKSRKQLTPEELENGLPINIMADKSVPYALLKKIMQTSASAGYTNISLAVEQVYTNTDELLEQAESQDSTEAGQ